VVSRVPAGGDVSSATPSAALAPQVRAGATEVIRRLEGFRPLYVLSVLVAFEWLTILGVALAARHNGWLYYQGGDELWHYVTAWVMGQGRLPHTSVGYAWSIVLLPFALLGGPNLVSPLPFIILLNVLVLMPVALVAAYGIGQRIGGRLFGYWVVALWILVPLIGIKYTDAGYHQRYTELLLPQSLGLTALSDFPSLVASIVAAYFALRAVQDDSPWDGLFAGLFAGVALGIKPSNAPLLVGIGLALLAARRWRSIGWLAVGVAPGILALAVWKARGEGNLPILHSGAAGTHLVLAHAAPVVGLGLHISRYVHPSWSYFTAELHDVEQHFWSVRVLEWLTLAGTIGLLRRSWPLGLLFGGWFWTAIIVKWSTPGHGTIADSDLLRQTISTIPAALMLIAGVVLLFPGLPQKLRDPEPSPWTTHRIRIGLAATLVTLFGVVPVALAAGLPRLSTRDTISYYTLNGTSLSAPFAVDTSWRTTAVSGVGAVRLVWPRLTPLGGTMDYVVLRAPAGQEINCGAEEVGARCALTGAIVTATHAASFVDKPPPGSWTYRVAAVASWINDPTAGNIFVAGPPMTVTARR
jgi:dolichyl-phosphate-mannose-protein mannosyltransferase